jgi:hypothetical protein
LEEKDEDLRRKKGEQPTHATLAKPGLGRSRRPVRSVPKPIPSYGLSIVFVVVPGVFRAGQAQEWWPSREVADREAS